MSSQLSPYFTVINFLSKLSIKFNLLKNTFCSWASPGINHFFSATLNSQEHFLLSTLSKSFNVYEMSLPATWNGAVYSAVWNPVSNLTLFLYEKLPSSGVDLEPQLPNKPWTSLEYNKWGSTRTLQECVFFLPPSTPLLTLLLSCLTHSLSPTPSLFSASHLITLSVSAHYFFCPSTLSWPPTCFIPPHQWQ